MIEEVIKINTEDGARTVKDLRKELKSLKDELLNTQKGTEEYAQVMQKAANIQHDLKEQMQEINNSAMDFGQKMGNITKTMAGVSGAITAATGAMSLFGVQNEEAQKKITATMTTLIGITQGLSKIDEGVKAFKRLTIAINASSKSMNGFKMALISTGLGALVVVLGSIIAYWDEFTAAIGLSAEKMQKFGDIAKGVLNVITSGMKGIAKSLGKLIKGDFKGAWEELKDGFSVVKNFNEGVANSAKKREDEMTAKAKEEAAKRAKAAEEEYKKRIAAAEKLAKYERDMAMSQLRGKDTDKYSEKSRQIQEKYFDTLFKLYRKDSDEYKNLVLEKEQWLQDWENHQIEVDTRKQQQLDEEIKREQEARASLLQSFKDSLKTERQLLDEKYRNLIDAAVREGEDTTEIFKWYEEQKTAIAKKEEEKREEQRKSDKETVNSYYSDETFVAQKEALDKEYKIAIEAAKRLGEDTNNIDREYLLKRVKLYTTGAATIASSIGDIFGSISDMMEQGSEEQKGMAIASTTIQTLVGIATALSGAFTSKTGVWDIAIAAAQAASIAASGIATISKIKSVKSDGSGSNVSTPSVSMPAVVNSTSDFSQSVDGALTQTAIKDQRVYVTEHDITDTQKKVQVTESRARY